MRRVAGMKAIMLICIRPGVIFSYREIKHGSLDAYSVKAGFVTVGFPGLQTASSFISGYYVGKLIDVSLKSGVGVGNEIDGW